MQTALLVIDVQCGLDEPYFGDSRSTPECEDNIERLITHWRQSQRPVIHVKHNSTEPNSPLRPGQPGNDIKPQAQPVDGEPLFEKSVNSAFIGTELEAWLRERSIRDLVVVGLTTGHCVSTSVRMAGNLGFNVTLVSDGCAMHACGGFDAETVHLVNLATLDGEFCKLVKTADLLRNGQ